VDVTSWATLSTIGPWGLVTLFVLMVFSGVLVPGREVRYWRKAFFAEQEMRRDLEATGRVVRTVVQALPDPPPSPEDP
jgi:hypothetical protein